MAVTVTPPGTAAQPLNSPDHATWAGQVYADLRSLDTAVAGAGAWGSVATWSALPVTGTPGQQVRVMDGLGLCVAVWNGTAWVVDPVSDTGWRAFAPINGWTNFDTTRMRRQGQFITTELNLNGSAATSDVLWIPTAGWESGALMIYPLWSGTVFGPLVMRFGAQWDTSLRGGGMYGGFTYLAAVPWPTSAPT